jgi:hypothetical protein
LKVDIFNLLNELRDGSLQSAGVIPWSCPVPSFGDARRATVATLGLNPSNREFVDAEGEELDGGNRRFHTLRSLGLSCWSKADDRHLEMIADSCKNYFRKNPYDGWFRRLDEIILGTNSSYYDERNNVACHLDLVPFATAAKWMELKPHQKTLLLSTTGDALGHLLRNSAIKILILNGASVIAGFEAISKIPLLRVQMSTWSLPRRNGADVTGYSYEGAVRKVGGVTLRHDIQVLGFNHNIQSSFGVTKKVKSEIAQWITRRATRVAYEEQGYSAR